MRFHFTEEDRTTFVRARDLRAALVHAGHRVSHGEPGAPAPPGTDVWLHGLGMDGGPGITREVEEQLLGTPAAVFIYQLCDHVTLGFASVPPGVMARTSRFLRNHWPSDKASVPEAALSRLGWMPPMLKPMAPDPGKSLSARARRAILYATRTGSANLNGEMNARELCVRLLRESALPFQGGIVPHSDPHYRVEPSLATPRISAGAHARLLRDSRICVAPWGNHVLTYRFFEGLAQRCLVVAQSLRATEFLDGGLEPGRHYVEVAADLGDLTEKVGFYLDNEREAQRIADAGHEHFTRHFASRGPLVSSYIFDATVESWGEFYRPATPSGISSALRSAAARIWTKAF